MKKVALVLVVAVFVPSLVLAWLAVRSLRDQQFVLERQESLLYQGTADGMVKDIRAALDDAQRAFTIRLATILGNQNPRDVARTFDSQLRRTWPLAEVGFAVTMTGQILAPAMQSSPEARAFLADNSRFLANRESAEVYLNNRLAFNNSLPIAQNESTSTSQSESNFATGPKPADNSKVQMRYVIPQQAMNPSPRAAAQEQQQVSRVAVSEAEFGQLIGDQNDGMLARFINNKLKLLLWCRAATDRELIFGAQLALPGLEEQLRPIIQQLDPALRDQICVALLDDTAKPVALSRPGFQVNWKRPFVASEVGEALPHWEVGIYLLNPAKIAQSAQMVKLTLGLVIGLLVSAIAVGSWLIVSDLRRQLTEARQKTDFVSNVSHELKTPLTSIRMFSELLAEGRVTDPGKQRSYLQIITAESARLTRLINNVLDFARIERQKYSFELCDIVALARDTAESYRPHLESNGFTLECELPATPICVNGDRDALSQVLLNLLSNAEKYGGTRQQIKLTAAQESSPLPYVQLCILDRGLGIPPGCEEKIFEKFYRADDSLSSGIQGSGLGLTLARQTARAHGGDVVYEPRDGGGSCFCLRLPIAPAGENRG